MYLVIKPENVSTFDKFVKFWSTHYNYKGDPNLYNSNIAVNQFEERNILGLYLWKNGTGASMSNRKQGSLAKIIDKLEDINALKVSWSQAKFDATFGHLSAIWKIFLMHIIHPDRFPIFDMHVYRAFAVIENRENRSLMSFSNKGKYNICLKDYLPFYRSLEYTDMDHVKVDQALWAFGKFAATYSSMVI